MDENIKNVIYNLILMLNNTFDTMDIDTESFIDWICINSGLSKNDYKNIMFK